MISKHLKRIAFARASRDSSVRGRRRDQPTDRRYTGQRLSEDLGLYDYRARWYDPLLGRFLMEDTIIAPQGVMSLERYSYAKNSPVVFVDPSGHRTCTTREAMTGDETCFQNYKAKAPDSVDSSDLTAVSMNIEYSGEQMYELYKQMWNDDSGWWWSEFGGDGQFSVEDFMILMLAYEFGPYENDGKESDYLSDQFIEDLTHAGTTWFWCSPNGDTNACTNLRAKGGYTNADILNWLAGLESAERRYDDVYVLGMSIEDTFVQGEAYIRLARDVTKTILYPTNMKWATGMIGLNTPNGWANAYLFPNFHVTGQGPGYTQYFQKFGEGRTAAYILSACQTAYQKGDMRYVNTWCR